MAEVTAQQQETVDTGANQEGSSAAAFSPIETQAQLDEIVKARLNRERAKYADYEELKKKAAKLDELDAASKTELEKAIERAESAESELSKLRAEAERAAWVAEVARDTGMPAELVADLSANSKEELAEKAKRHAESTRAKSVPYIGSDGSGRKSPGLSSADEFASFAGEYLFR